MDDQVRALRGCLGKRPFETKKAARETAGRVRRISDRVLKPYRCGNCGMYHLTSYTKADERRVRARRAQAAEEAAQEQVDTNHKM